MLSELNELITQRCFTHHLASQLRREGCRGGGDLAVPAVDARGGGCYAGGEPRPYLARACLFFRRFTGKGETVEHV